MNQLTWNHEKDRYEGVTAKGRRIAVEGVEYSESVADAVKEGTDEDEAREEFLEVSQWEALIGSNQNVYYIDKQGREEAIQTPSATYYERVTKPKRNAARQEKLAKLGVPRLPRGPGRKYGPERLDIHLKFSDEAAQFIREQSREIGYQAFFDGLVKELMEHRQAQHEFFQNLKKS